MDAGTWVRIATLMMAAFLVGTDFTGALLLVPAVESELNADITTTQWVLNIYALTFAMFMVAGGRLGDLHGRRRMMLIGLLIFLASAAVCMLSPTIGWLIGARAVQGFGAALIWPALLAFAALIVAEEDRGFAMGMILAGVTTGNVVGPLIGGFADYLGNWRLFFLFNVLLAAVCLVLTFRVMPDEEGSAQDEKVDYAGMLVFSAALLALLYGLDVGADWGWASPPLIALLVLSVVLFVLFPFVEARVADPTVPLPMMRNRQFVLTLSTNGLLIPTIFIAFLYFPQFMQKVLGWSVLEASFGMLPLMIPLTVGSIIAGNYYTTFGPKRLLFAGYLLVSLAAIWLILPTANLGYFTLLPAMLLAGLGAPMAIGPAGTAAVSAVAPTRAGLAGGLSFMFHLTFGATGVAGATAIMYVSSRSTLQKSASDAGMTLTSSDISVLNAGTMNSPAVQELLSRLGAADADKLRTLVPDAFAVGMSNAYWLPFIAALIGLLVIMAIDESKLHDVDK